MFRGSQTALSCATEATHTTLQSPPSPPEDAVSSIVGRSSRVRRRGLRWLTWEIYRAGRRRDYDPHIKHQQWRHSILMITILTQPEFWSSHAKHSWNFEEIPASVIMSIDVPGQLRVFSVKTLFFQKNMKAKPGFHLELLFWREISFIRRFVYKPHLV